MPNIALVIPCVNNFKGCCELLQSIYTNESSVQDSPLNIVPIIIPNWDINIGVSAAWNRGIYLSKKHQTKFDAILVSNDDIIIPNYSVRAMYDRLMDKSKPVPLVSARNTKDRPGFDNTLEDLVNFITPDEGDSPDFSCFMITYETIVRFGWFDESFTPAYFEDNDYHHRIHCLGAITANIGSAPMYHKSSVSRKLEKKEAPLVSNKQFENNRAYYKTKWGGLPGKEVFTNPFGDPYLSVREVAFVHNKGLENA